VAVNLFIRKSIIAKKTASQAGLTRISGVVLVAIKHQLLNADLKLVKASARYRFVKTGSSVELKVEPISIDENIAVRDIFTMFNTYSCTNNATLLTTYYLLTSFLYFILFFSN
jgi:hypothetical protein